MRQSSTNRPTVRAPAENAEHEPAGELRDLRERVGELRRVGATEQQDGGQPQGEHAQHDGERQRDRVVADGGEQEPAVHRSPGFA